MTKVSYGGERLIEVTASEDGEQSCRQIGGLLIHRQQTQRGAGPGASF